MAFTALRKGAASGVEGASKVATVFTRQYSGIHETVWSRANIDASRKLNKMIETNPPFQRAAGRLCDAVDPIIKELAKEKKVEKKLKSKDIPLFVPAIPHLLPVARMVRDSETWREILIYDDEKHANVRPRLSWYHPEDTLVPRGWFKDGLVADWNYYFGYLGLEVNFGQTPTASVPMMDQRMEKSSLPKATEEKLPVPSRELLELSNLNTLDAEAFMSPAKPTTSPNSVNITSLPSSIHHQATRLQ